MNNVEGILLRPARASDASLLMKWENDQENWSVSDTKSEFTLTEIIQLIESMENLEIAKQARFMIINKSSNVALGAIDLFAIDFEKEIASVGVLVADTNQRNRGIAHNAIIQIEAICYEELGIYTLLASVHGSNLPSVRLFEKSGFSKKKLTQDAQLNNADYIETIIFEKCLKK